MFRDTAYAPICLSLTNWQHGQLRLPLPSRMGMGTPTLF